MDEADTAIDTDPRRHRPEIQPLDRQRPPSPRRAAAGAAAVAPRGVDGDGRRGARARSALGRVRSVVDRLPMRTSAVDCIPARRARRREGDREDGAAGLHAQGHERRRRAARVVQGQGHPAELLGDVVPPLQGRDSRSRSRYRTQYKDDIVVLGFSIDDTPEELQGVRGGVQDELSGARRRRPREHPGGVRADVGRSGHHHHRPRRQDREEAVGDSHASSSSSARSSGFSRIPTSIR